MSLKGKTLFITGGSRGIGLAIALKAAADGANVAIAAKTVEPHPKLEGTIHTAAALIAKVGGGALPLAVDVRDEAGAPLIVHHLSLTPFRRIVKDYFLMCESYYQAIRTQSPSQIEAIDMGRRGLHNEGSELLMERLKTKIGMDFDTARRLFTLISVLHWKG
jgi:uncharacterized protein (UPF0262 family)